MSERRDGFSCGSQRKHEGHDWIGQTTGGIYWCPGFNRSRGESSVVAEGEDASSAKVGSGEESAR